MNDSNERFIPEAVGEQEAQQDQMHYQAWQRSSQQKFVYGLERVENADVHSLDRVWGRLVERAESNGIVYHANGKIVHLRERRKRSARKSREARVIGKCREFAGRFDKVATACILTLLVGSMIFVFNAMHHATNATSGTAASKIIHTTAVSLQENQPQTVEISIVLDKDGRSAFGLPSLKIPVRTIVIWRNQTALSQVAVSESDHHDVSLAPGGAITLNSESIGIFAWHLQSNPNARFVASVFGTATVNIMLSKAMHTFDFVPNKLHLTLDSVVLWVNTTNQDQIVVSDKNASPLTIKLAATKYINMPVNTTGNYPFHLASDPQASFLMVVDA